MNRTGKLFGIYALMIFGGYLLLFLFGAILWTAYRIYSGFSAIT